MYFKHLPSSHEFYPKEFSQIFLSSIEADSAASRSDEWSSAAWEALCPRGLRWARPRTLGILPKWGSRNGASWQHPVIVVGKWSYKWYVYIYMYICIIMYMYVYVYICILYIYISMMVSHGDFGIACFQTKPDLNTVISWSANLFEQVAPPWATTNLEKLGESSDPREEYNTLHPPRSSRHAHLEEGTSMHRRWMDLKLSKIWIDMGGS